MIYKILIVLIFLTLITNKAESFEASLAPFNLEINGKLVEHNISFRAVLGNELLNFKSKNPNTKLQFDNKSIDFVESKLAWKAPELTGHYSLSFTNGIQSIKIQMFVMVAKSNLINGQLGSYKIGKYPPPLKGLKSYQSPVGFIQVTKELSGLKISPHFTLGQFVCKQSSGYPKYVVLRPRLLEKLEFLLHEINQKGIAAESFVIMSGYRTPYYNKAIGNVSNSRHIYGGAADIFIDSNPMDNYMDDLNSDGEINSKDSKYLYDIADQFVKKTKRNDITGGVGLYKSNSVHGPFVHVDVRGFSARW